MLQALIFDFDGLIIETEGTGFQAWREMCQRYGVELTLETWLPSIGRGATTKTFDPYDYLVAHLGYELEREAVRAACLQRNLELIEAQPILPGVQELLHAARQRGLKLAVASSSQRPWVDGHLTRLGLRKYFDVLVCGNEAEHTKPYPDLYLGALARLNVRAEQAVALEDSLNGMTAAQSAGIFCVLVPSALTQYQTFGQVDLRVSSLAEVSLEDLEQRLSGEAEPA